MWPPRDPGVPVGGVGGAHVNRNAGAPPMGLGQQAFEVVVAAVSRVDLVVIGYVIAVVAGRSHDRHQPQARHAQVTGGGRIAIVEIVQLGDEAVQVANAVAVGVIEGCLLYTSDAADERSSVDLGGRRIIKKKKQGEYRGTS